MESYSSNPEVYDRYSEIFKALGHPIRLCIVRGLIETEGSNVTKMQDCLNIPQSTISQHIAKLKAAGIIEGDRRGLEITYSVVDPTVKALITALLNASH